VPTTYIVSLSSLLLVVLAALLTFLGVAGVI